MAWVGESFIQGALNEEQDWGDEWSEEKSGGTSEKLPKNVYHYGIDNGINN